MKRSLTITKLLYGFGVILGAFVPNKVHNFSVENHPAMRTVIQRSFAATAPILINAPAPREG